MKTKTQNNDLGGLTPLIYNFFFKKKDKGEGKCK